MAVSHRQSRRGRQRRDAQSCARMWIDMVALVVRKEGGRCAVGGEITSAKKEPSELRPVYWILSHFVWHLGG